MLPDAPLDLPLENSLGHLIRDTHRLISRHLSARLDVFGGDHCASMALSQIEPHW